MTVREYPGCYLVRIKDGDTIVVDWDLGRETWAREEEIRLNGLDTAPLKTAAGDAAAAFVTQWFTDHCPDRKFTLRTTRVDKTRIAQLPRDEREKYGRYLGEIIAPDGANLNLQLIATGNAKPWKGQGPKPW